MACPPGTILNPHTRKCISVRGRKARELARAGDIPPLPIQQRKRATGPVGPVRTLCSNDVDPITGVPFDQEDPSQIVRLHDGTCALASGLSQHVAAAHKSGVFARMPGPGHEQGQGMTRENYLAMRAAMRRRNPTYRLPPLRHRPHPPEWGLYIASDNLSGPDFASVLFVDTTLAYRKDATSLPVYPMSAIRLNLGFIPITASSLDSKPAACTTQTIANLMVRLDELHGLLEPVPGGYRPVPSLGFPFTKQSWLETTDPEDKLADLCFNLDILIKKKQTGKV